MPARRVLSICRTLVSAVLIGWFGGRLNPPVKAEDADRVSDWTIYITNDTCPDYTWGLTEDQTRHAFADLVQAHLDLMAKTDQQARENQDRYNMAVTQEALCFIQYHPDRTNELIRRIKEGRAYLSPFLCNSLWGFHSTEGAIRTLYPARRLEREWGIPIEVAHHIEEPALPWGMASILAGCSIRWLSIPYYDYDSTFSGLNNPPLFIYEGPDGQTIRVILDKWASERASYAQGAYLLNKPSLILTEWLPHYRSLDLMYAAQALLVSGTHSDISLHSREQAAGFAETLRQYNLAPGFHPKLSNAILPQFCRAIDNTQARIPFLPSVKGCFGHSWDVWPVSLAKYAIDMRQGEREYLVAEALLAVASQASPGLGQTTRHDRERAEWSWAMLSDHAWNGTDDANRNVNAELRRKWSEDLLGISRKLTCQALTSMGVKAGTEDLILFNGLSTARSGLVRIEVPSRIGTGMDGDKELASQVVEEPGRRVLHFVAPLVPAFGFKNVILKDAPRLAEGTTRLRATPLELESPYYSLRIDPKTGGLSSLRSKTVGIELVQGQQRSLCQTVYFDGREHLLQYVKCAVVACGPVMARLKITGQIEAMAINNLVTLYADLDRIDFDVRVKKPVTTQQERLCQVFPLWGEGAVIRIETPGAVIRPEFQPEGDLLPGADPRRFAVQGFVDIEARGGWGVTLVPLDAFVLRRDLEAVTFEALGNDQNYKEVMKDQHGVTEFRFRYSLRAYKGEYRAARSFNFSRDVGTDLLVAPGKWNWATARIPRIVIDPDRAVATCLKPAESGEPGSCLLRLWEVEGKAGPLKIQVHGFSRAFQTDLLERDLHPLTVANGELTLELRALGLAAVRLLP